jgi:hypothetical protein
MSRSNGSNPLRLRSAILLTLLGWCITSPPALAQRSIESAHEILPGCRAFLVMSQEPIAFDELELVRGGVCAGKISALLNVAPVLDPRFRFCRPETVTVRQAIEVVLKRLEGNPEVWNQLFDALAVEAFVDAWPCT